MFHYDRKEKGAEISRVRARALVCAQSAARRRVKLMLIAMQQNQTKTPLTRVR